MYIMHRRQSLQNIFFIHGVRAIIQLSVGTQKRRKSHAIFTPYTYENRIRFGTDRRTGFSDGQP